MGCRRLSKQTSNTKVSDFDRQVYSTLTDEKEAARSILVTQAG